VARAFCSSASAFAAFFWASFAARFWASTDSVAVAASKASVVLQLGSVGEGFVLGRAREGEVRDVRDRTR
jgi:hypothetical protein